MAEIFWRNLKRPQVKEIIKTSYSIIGWNISDSKYHSTLKNVLDRNNLHALSADIDQNISKAVCLTSSEVEGSQLVNISYCISKDSSDGVFCMYLLKAAAIKNKLEKSSEIERSNRHKTVITPTIWQQKFCDLLSMRGYVSYEYNQLGYLWLNIAYAYAGPPDENFYPAKVEQEVNKLVEKIKNKNSKFSGNTFFSR